jgi:hypothetical protein
MAQDSLLYERCYRCRCVVPNGLVHRRTMRTGHSKGTVIGTGVGMADLDHYEQVSLCGVCDLEVQTAAREKAQREGAWVCRYLGVMIGTVVLSWASVPWPVSLLTMLVLARLRMVGRSLIAMYVVAELWDIETLFPTQYLSQFVLPWAVVMSGFIMWRIGRNARLFWPFSWLTWKRLLLIGGHR